MTRDFIIHMHMYVHVYLYIHTDIDKYVYARVSFTMSL
jgi:hypothetical protein